MSYNHTLSLAYKIRDEMAYLKESLASADRIADEVVFVIDDRSVDGTKEYCEELQKQNPDKYKVFVNKFENHTKQKNFLLSKCSKDYVLFLDGDEILTDNAERIREVIDSTPEANVFSFVGHHYIYSLHWEDNKVSVHYWHGRLIKRLPEMGFVGENHELLTYTPPAYLLQGVEVHHFGYVKHLQKIMDKYEEDMRIKQIHTEEFLMWWKDAHILGYYPVKEYSGTYPTPILKKFGIEHHQDIDYFRTRDKLELKHFIDAWHWKEAFRPRNALLPGCGMGQRVAALRSYDVDAVGFDISEYAVKRTPHTGVLSYLSVGDIRDMGRYDEGWFDLVVVYDVFEHLPYDDLKKALEETYRVGNKNYVFSIPFKGDPNLEADPTHIIKEEKDWWLQKIQEAGFKIVQTPDFFQYKEQLVVCLK